MDAVLIGNYFGHPFLFYNRNSGQMLLLGHAMQQRVNTYIALESELLSLAWIRFFGTSRIVKPAVFLIVF